MRVLTRFGWQGRLTSIFRSKGKRQGASTLTMQLARNLFLSADQTVTRKLQEILLSVQMERHFTKQQIFTLYANQIYLGRWSLWVRGWLGVLLLQACPRADPI